MLQYSSLVRLCRRCLSSSLSNQLYGKTYYDVLGVSPSSTQKEIRAAYLNLCKKYHPDRLNREGTKYEKNQFLRISEAYETLSKASLRAEYDLCLRRDECPSNINSPYQKNFYRRKQQYYQGEANFQNPYFHHAYRKNMEESFKRSHLNQNPDLNFGHKLQTTFVSLVVVIVTFIFVLQV